MAPPQCVMTEDATSCDVLLNQEVAGEQPVKMATFALTFVRHGETQYNRDKLLQGQGVDTPLSETGVQQCEAVGQYLRDIKFCKVFVSNLQRAVQTAEIILRNNTHRSSMKMILEPLLRERGFGVAEGHDKEYLRIMAKGAGQSCRDFTPPGGETIDQVKQRFKNFLELLFKQMLDDQETPTDVASSNDSHQGASAHVLVVSHGAYIRVAVRHLLEDLRCVLPEGVKMSQLLSPCPNTGVSRFVVTLSRSESGPLLSDARCLFTNRKEHLEDLTPTE